MSFGPSCTIKTRSECQGVQRFDLRNSVCFIAMFCCEYKRKDILGMYINDLSFKAIICVKMSPYSPCL